MRDTCVRGAAEGFVTVENIADFGILAVILSIRACCGCFGLTSCGIDVDSGSVKEVCAIAKGDGCVTIGFVGVANWLTWGVSGVICSFPSLGSVVA